MVDARDRDDTKMKAPVTSFIEMPILQLYQPSNATYQVWYLKL